MTNKAFTIAFLLTLGPTISVAGEADNVSGCIQAVQDFAGRTVDEFDARYDGKFIDLSEVHWDGIVCAVKLGLVFDLTVDGEILIVDRFAGEDAKKEFERLEASTEKAIAVLESRKQILERRLEEAETKLQKANPDIERVTAHIEDGISKALGQ